MLLSLVLGLVACGGGNGDAAGDGNGGSTGGGDGEQEPASISVVGGAVKGPLANASVEVFALDPDAANGEGRAIATAATDAQGALTDLELPAETSGLLLFVFRADADTRDLTTSAAPVIDRLTTVVPAAAIIDDGRPVFASPLTTVITRVALANADRRAFGGNGDGSVGGDEMRAALAAAAQRTRSLFGFGLLDGIDVRQTPPMLLAGVTDAADTQDAVTRHRTAAEALGCVAHEVAAAIDDANAGNTSTTADAAFEALAADAVDGTIDGTGPDGTIDTYGADGVDAAAAVIVDDPGDCPIPNDPDGRTVADTEQILVAELSATGNSGADTSGVSDPPIAAGRARSNIDGDASPDSSDGDIDGDGIDNAADDTPLVPNDGTSADARPTAADDSASVDEDGSVTIDVLANDEDIDGTLDAASVTITSGVGHGSTSLDAATGAITYTPDGDFNGSDGFRYTVADDAGEPSSPASVDITVDAVNDAPTAVDDTASVDEDNSVTVNVLANDDDIDGNLDTASVTVTGSGAGHGSTSVDAATGETTYTPDADFNGSDGFSYTVADDDGVTSNPASVDITINAVNDVPTAVDDTASVDEDNSVTIDVLANDDDIDGSVDPASVTVTSAAGHGDTSVNAATGAITYTPDADFNGSDGFSYTVADDAGATSTPANVDITVNPVNDAPVAVDDTATVKEDMSVAIDVLANDSDIDDSLDNASVSVTSGPANGTTSIDPATGAITYTPDTDFDDSDSFNYTVTDDGGASSGAATVNIDITPVTPLEVDVTFPTANAKVIGVDQITVSGRIRDTDDGKVEFDDINYIDVNDNMVTPPMSDPAQWTRAPIDIAGQATATVNAEVESNSGHVDTTTHKFENEVQFDIPESVAVDAANDRALVTDVGLDVVFAVDRASGRRTIFSGNGNGSGPGFKFPRAIAIDAANDRALVLDDGLNAVVAVDLVSGDRTILSDNNAGPGFSTAASIVVDAADNRALVANSGTAAEDAVYAIDLDSGNRTILSNDNTGSGTGFTKPKSIALDRANNRALVQDGGFGDREVFAVDLDSGNRTILTSGGDGYDFVDATAIAVDAANHRAFVAERGFGQVFVINLAADAPVELAVATQ